MAIDFDKYCKRCQHYEFNDNQGILCGLTHDKPAFENHCDDFKLDFDKEKSASKSEQASSFRHEDEGMTGGEWAGVILCWPFALFKFFSWVGNEPKKVKQVCVLYLVAFIINVIVAVLSENM